MEKTNKLSHQKQPLQKEAYKVWSSMHYRAGNIEGYLDVTISDDWYEFENFYNWYVVSYVEGWQLDKDILVQGNREYSPNTCLMVPAVINSLFTRSKSKHGYKGVFFDKRNNKYYAQMRIDGKTKQYGSSSDPKVAHQYFIEIRRERISDLRNLYESNHKLHKALQQYI